MNETGANKTFKCSVNCYLVGAVDSDFFCDLLSAERLSGGKEGAQYGNSGFGPAKVCGGKESVNFFDKFCLHWFSCACICGWLCLSWTGQGTVILISDLTNSSGKTMSLKQQGNQTERKRMTKKLNSAVIEALSPKVISRYAADAQVLIRMWRE